MFWATIRVSIICFALSSSLLVAVIPSAGLKVASTPPRMSMPQRMSPAPFRYVTLKSPFWPYTPKSEVYTRAAIRIRTTKNTGFFTRLMFIFLQ